jgi:hypothetical protein
MAAAQAAGQLATLADGSPACSPRDRAQVFLVHDINFHRGIARQAIDHRLARRDGVGVITAHERRRATAGARSTATCTAADAHRRIYQAIRGKRARSSADHLVEARASAGRAKPARRIRARQGAAAVNAVLVISERDNWRRRSRR